MRAAEYAIGTTISIKRKTVVYRFVKEQDNMWLGNHIVPWDNEQIDSLIYANKIASPDAVSIEEAKTE